MRNYVWFISKTKHNHCLKYNNFLVVIFPKTINTHKNISGIVHGYSFVIIFLNNKYVPIFSPRYFLSIVSAKEAVYKVLEQLEMNIL